MALSMAADQTSSKDETKASVTTQFKFQALQCKFHDIAVDTNVEVKDKAEASQQDRLNHPKKCET